LGDVDADTARLDNPEPSFGRLLRDGDGNLEDQIFHSGESRARMPQDDQPGVCSGGYCSV